MPDMVDIIIVSHNRLKMLKKCLSSIRRHTSFREYNITVVDNRSTDGTREFLKESSKLNYILLNYNKGCPKAFNLVASKTHNDFVVSLNDDLEVTEGWLDKLYEEMKPGVGIVGVKPVCPDGRIFCADQLPNTFGDIGRGEKDNSQRDYIKECDAVWGGCLLIPRELFKKVGYFDEKLLIFEDIDFCLRTRVAGYKVIYNGGVTIVHRDAQRPKLKPHQSLKRLIKKWNNFSCFPLKDSNPVDKANTLGLKWLQRGWYKRALKEFKRTSGFGEIFIMHKFIGYACHNLGRYSEALSEYRKALRRNSEDSQACRLMGVSLETQQRYKEALQYFRKAVKIYPSYSDGYDSLGVHYLNRDKPAKAISFFKKAIEYDKFHPSAYYNLGLTYEVLVNYKEAKRSYKNTLRINPEDKQAKKNLEKLSG